MHPLVLAMFGVKRAFLQRPKLEGEARAKLLERNFFATLELVPEI
jgi:hypothetical protein